MSWQIRSTSYNPANLEVDLNPSVAALPSRFHPSKETAGVRHHLEHPWKLQGCTCLENASVLSCRTCPLPWPRSSAAMCTAAPLLSAWDPCSCLFLTCCSAQAPRQGASLCGLLRHTRPAGRSLCLATTQRGWICQASVVVQLVGQADLEQVRRGDAKHAVRRL